MKKKYIKDTYLLGVSDYDIACVKDNDKNAYIAVKYIRETDNPYIETHSGKNICLLANGYYVLEYVPINKNYVVRVFLNEKKEVQEYYIDITKENGYDKENNSPFYLDLFLDVTVLVPCDNKVRVWDENELEEAVRSKDITQDDYDLAYKTLKELLEEISNETNMYITSNHKEMIDTLLKNSKTIRI